MVSESPSLDSVTTIRPDGSRPFLFPADVRGRFARARRISAAGLIVFYLSLPWIRVNGHPAVFLDLAARRFHLVGFTFSVQDAWLLFFLISGLGFALFFITATLGRVWCGWACPQTIFLDHVFRRLERWIDGNALDRRALAAAPLTGAKLLRRALKHALYLGTAAVIAHLFLAYYVSLPAVWSMIRAAPGEHLGTFAFMAVSTAVLYFNFAWFREQLCIVICPYGRLQSALIDEHSLVVAYDPARGEPRGRSGTPGAGDCVACQRCVQVCPTGIDIRQGLQLECIGCTACIDACDEVMTRLRRPTGLIRYSSLTALAGRATRWLRPRTVLYLALLVVGAGVFGWAASGLRPANLGVTRIVGAPYLLDADAVRNQFLVRIVNKRNEPARFVVHVAGGTPELRQSGLTGVVTVPPLGEAVQPLVLVLPRASFRQPFPLRVQVTDEAGRLHLERTLEFLGPSEGAARPATK